MNGVVSIKDVAARAGVSPATVSNVLNRPTVVAAATRRRVQAAIAELGFVRNESARQLRAGTSRFIGLVLRDVSNPFFTDVARGVEDLANESGLAVLLCNSDDQLPREDRYLDLLQEHRVRGILITPSGNDSGHLGELRKRGVPVVLVDQHAAEGQCSVSVDDRRGGDVAVTHLIERGHERIAFVGGPFSLRQNQDRYDGAVRAVQRAGREPSSLRVATTAALNVVSGRRAASALADLEAGERPTAMFCANDLVALGVLQELTSRHIVVPDECALVGYDDIDFAASATVPLSSVRQPRIEIGRAAAELLIDETSDDTTHEHRQVVFQPDLIVRQSSDFQYHERAFAGSTAGT
jgi:LacI family transcriptional regulator